jgi:hypothetical protein
LLEGARKFVFPAGLLDSEPDTVLLCVPVPVVPYFRRFFAQMESPYVWKTPTDYQRAYPIFAEIEAQMAAASCVSTITTSIDRLYRLLDTALNGTEYTVDTPTDMVVPSIAVVPPTSASAANALRAHVGRLVALTENATSGAIYAADVGIDGAPALIDDQTARDLIRRLTRGVDGNTDPAPADNLLMALRGTTEASTTRNVIDTRGSDLGPLLDQVETLLTEIRDKLV